MDDDGNVPELDAAIEATWAAAQHDADMVRGVAWRVFVHDWPQFDVVVPTWREAQHVALARFGAGFGVSIAPVADPPPFDPPLTDEEADAFQRAIES